MRTTGAVLGHSPSPASLGVASSGARDQPVHVARLQVTTSTWTSCVLGAGSPRRQAPAASASSLGIWREGLGGGQSLTFVATALPTGVSVTDGFPESDAELRPRWPASGRGEHPVGLGHGPGFAAAAGWLGYVPEHHCLLALHGEGSGSDGAVSHRGSCGRSGWFGTETLCGVPAQCSGPWQLMAASRRPTLSL